MLIKKAILHFVSWLASVSLTRKTEHVYQERLTVYQKWRHNFFFLLSLPPGPQYLSLFTQL